MRKVLGLGTLGLACTVALVNCSDDGSSSSSGGFEVDAGSSGSTSSSGSSGSSGASGSSSGGGIDAGPPVIPVSIGGTLSGLIVAATGDAGASDAGVSDAAVTDAGANDGGAGDAGPASGLVLQNNGGDDLALLKNGAFTFSKKQNKGTAYAVTLKSQPYGQTCAVTKGSGNANADVSDVAVSCAPNDYEVSLDVSGMNGKGLEVVLDGAETLTLNANGPAKFTTKVKYNASYAVTIKTQPNRPTGACTLGSGSGTVGGNVTVGVTCTDNVLAAATYASDRTIDIADVTQMGGPTFFPTALAFDGTDYWVGSLSESTNATRLVRYSAAFAYITGYDLPGRRVLSLFSAGGKAPNLLFKGYQGTDIDLISDVNSGTGALTNKVTLNPASGGVNWVVLNSAGTELIGNNGGTILRWDPATGAGIAGNVTLAGFGSVPDENTSWWNRHIFSASGYYITVANDQVSVWTSAGVRVRTATLTGAPAAADPLKFPASIAVSYCNDRLWIWQGTAGGSTSPTGKWLGYDLGL